MTLPIKKIYIDTKFKTIDSISNSDFKIDLGQSLLFPDNTAFYIDDVCIPHSWTTVEHFNNKLYFRVIGESINPTDHIITLESQVYNGQSLSAQISSKFISLGYTPIISYNASKHQLAISITTYAFKILTDFELKNPSLAWSGESYDSNNLQSVNELLKNTLNVSQTYNNVNPYLAYIDLQPIRNIYIHSSLGNWNTLGPRGETSIIKKVPVSSNFNEMIIDQVMTSNDFGDCSLQSMRTIKFDLKDSSGNHIPMHNAHLSFSIIFSRMSVNM